jgi:hypothetical protein
MAMQLGMTVEGVEDVLARLKKVPVSIQRKYLRAAVNSVAKSQLNEIKALTPRGPTGNLRRSVGVKIEAKKRFATQTAIVGYRRGSTKKGRAANKSELGYHSWWIERGVKTRTAKSGLLSVPSNVASRYTYFKNVRGKDGRVAFATAKGFAGTGKFEAWANANLPSIREALMRDLGKFVDKAIAEHERRQLRKIAGKG